MLRQSGQLVHGVLKDEHGNTITREMMLRALDEWGETIGEMIDYEEGRYSMTQTEYRNRPAIFVDALGLFRKLRNELRNEHNKKK